MNSFKEPRLARGEAMPEPDGIAIAAVRNHERHPMWYVVQVMGGQERQTLDLIARLKGGGALSDAFIPQREIMRHVEGEWVRQRENLFPGYVFVDTRKPDELFTQLGKVPAFTRLLGSEDAFVPLSREEQAVVQALIGDDHIAEVSEGIIEGGEVRILSGPLRDHDAIIAKIDRHKRCAYVRVNMLGREVDIKLGLEIVRKSA